MVKNRKSKEHNNPKEYEKSKEQQKRKEQQEQVKSLKPKEKLLKYLIENKKPHSRGFGGNCC